MASRWPNRILVMTALPVERDAVIRRLANVRSERHTTGIEYEIGRFESLDVCVVQIGVGNSSAALETERAIAFFEPNIAFFVGIAGGVKDVTLGDVVAGTKIYGYECGADRDDFQTRPEIGLASYPLVKAAEVLARKGSWVGHIADAEQKSTPRAFVGPIAAGAKVIKSNKGAIANLLRESYGDTLAVEMEGEGFMRAAYTNRVDAIVVRGISDLLEGKDLSDSHGWQGIASEHAAAFAFELMADLASQTFDGAVTRAASTERAKESSEERDAVDFWQRLRELLPRLYPRGPSYTSLWEDAGGDLSYLELSGNARTQWSRAVRLLENGGGGPSISAGSLIDLMSKDFGQNYELLYLRELLAQRTMGES